MAARRCLLHGSFPAQYEFTECPVCGQRTDYISNDTPDEHWESNVVRQQEWLAKAVADPPEIPTLEDAKVIFDGEHYYISTHDVIRGGINHVLRDTDLVQVGKQVFEILHHHDEQRRYLVRPFSTNLSDAQLAELAGP